MIVFRRLFNTRRWAFLVLIPAAIFGSSRATAQQPKPSPSDVQASLVKVPPEVPADARRFTVLLAGNRAGVLAVWTTPDRAHHNFFSFNDRGRGPAIMTRIVIGRDGIPTEIEATGNDYEKRVVNERFRLAGGKASWSNKSDKGEKAVSGLSFYVPIDAVLVGDMERALLASPGNRLPLLPEGEARIERVLDRPVQVGGRKRTATLYETVGLSFTGSPVWLLDDDTFFAAGSDWFALLPEGAGDVWPALLEAQKARAVKRGEEIAAKLRKKPGKPLVIQHARLFDSETAKVRDGMSVKIDGGRIAVVAPDGDASLGAGAGSSEEVLDAKGKMLLPGLWDMHVHLGEWDDGVLHLAAGVTTVRDLANDIDHLRELREKFDAGTLAGPRVIMAGFVDGRGPYQGPTKVFADTPEEAKADVERYKSLGYEQIKIYSSVKPELVPVIAAEAHRNGMRVSGHVPAFMTLQQAVEAGYDEVQHANFWFLNFLFDTVKDTRTPARFTEVAEHAAELDLNSDRVQAFVKVLQEHHTVLDPTVSVFEDLFVGRDGKFAPTLEPVANRLPPQIRRNFLAVGLPVPEGKDQKYRDSYRVMLQFLKKLHDAGVTIVAGTDDLAGFTLHRELINYVAAGIPAPRALQLATIVPARVMKREKTTGSIAPGKAADLILVNGDPTARITDIRRVVTVIKDGTLYDAAALYTALGVKPAD